MCAIFVAPGTSRIVCERVYFDAATILRRAPGIARSAVATGVATVLNHPVTIGRAVLRGLLRGGG